MWLLCFFFFFFGFYALFMRFISIFLAKIILKLGPTILFTRLKIILLQYFQFSTINDIQTSLIYVYLNVFIIEIINK